MSVTDVGKMRSVNMNGRLNEGTTVNDWLNSYQNSPAPGRYEGVGTGASQADVAENGIREPLEVGVGQGSDPGVLYDGHHRYAAAVAAGHSHVPVIPDEGYETPRKMR
jgi:hypothetical protein